jgi:sugar phosphate isomerase/epimerase
VKLSVTSWSFPACTLAECQGIAQALGIGHLDLGLLHGAALPRDRLLADPLGLAGEVAAAGIRAANLYWLFGPDPHVNAVSDPQALDRNLAELGPVLRFAEALEIPSLFVLPGVTRPGVPRAQLLAHSAAALRAMLPLAAQHGVALTVEPHVGGLLASPSETLRFLDAVPGLRLTLDYAHFACLGFPQEAIDPLAPHAAHVHLRQARPGALQAKWGEGTLDLGAQIETLREAGYDGFLSVEYVHQAYMSTLSDDVLTETVRMRDLARAHGVA